MNKKRLFDLLKIIISIVLIAFILSQVELNELRAVLFEANPNWLLLTVALVICGVVARATRWYMLLQDLDVRAPLKELVMIYFIGFFFNNFLPSGLGGDAVRMVELNRHTSRGSDAVTSVVVDRLEGLYGSIFLAGVTLIFAWRIVPPQVVGLLGIVFLGIVTGSVIMLNKPLYLFLRRISLFRLITDIKFVQNIFASFQTYTLRALWRAFLVSLLFNAILISYVLTIGQALRIDISPIYYLIFVPLASLVLLVPITFAGLGFREGAYVYLFGLVGVSNEAALALSLMIYAMGNLVPGLIGGLVFLWRSLQGWRPAEVAEQPVGPVEEQGEF